MAVDPNIPSVPSTVPIDQAPWFTAVKGCIEILMGQGRNTDANRALRVSEYMAGITKIQESLQESLSDFEQSMDIPDPPTNLIITKGVWSHHLTWDNPTDEIVSHIEIWVATNSQDRSNAVIRGVVTVTENLRGEKGSFDFSGLDVTDDLVYWIRSISYAGNHSIWEPPDDQGGYVVPGNETLDETINDIMDILKGSITEDQLYIDLSSRIDLIDFPATGLIDRISTVELATGSMPPFDPDVPNFVDDIVSYSDKIYVCIKNTPIPSPLPTNIEYWKAIGSSASLTGAMAANALAINNLDSRVVDTEDGITSIASELTLLTSEVGNNRSAIQTEQEARATAISAESARIDTLFTETGENRAAIVAEETARTSNDSALAQSINTVQSKLGNNFSSVETVSKAINGIEASHTIKVQADSNGKLVMAGIGLIADSVTQQSEIMMKANQFQIVIPGRVPTQPFIIKKIDGVDTVGISGNLVIDGKMHGKYIVAGSLSVTEGEIVNLAVSTLKIANNAVTVPESINYSTVVTGVDKTWRDVAYVVLYNTSNVTMHILGIFSARVGYPSGIETTGYRVLASGVILADYGTLSGGFEDFPTFQFNSTIDPNSQKRFTVQWYSDHVGLTMDKRSLTVWGVKR